MSTSRKEVGVLPPMFLACLVMIQVLYSTFYSANQTRQHLKLNEKLNWTKKLDLAFKNKQSPIAALNVSQSNSVNSSMAAVGRLVFFACSKCRKHLRTANADLNNSCEQCNQTLDKKVAQFPPKVAQKGYSSFDLKSDIFKKSQNLVKFGKNIWHQGFSKFHHWLRTVSASYRF